MSQEAVVRNAGDESQVNSAKRREKEDHRKAAEDMRFVLSSPQGRRVLWRYLSVIDRISAHNSGSWTYFNDGERNLALRIKADILAADPKAWIKMQVEQGEQNVK